MNTDIYHHNNITAKLWMLFTMTIFRTFKTKIMTNAWALIQTKPPGSVAERIKHEASNMLTYREKKPNPV